MTQRTIKWHYYVDDFENPCALYRLDHAGRGDAIGRTQKVWRHSARAVTYEWESDGDRISDEEAARLATAWDIDLEAPPILPLGEEPGV